MSAIDRWRLTRALDKKESGQAASTRRVPSVTTRQKIADPERLYSSMSSGKGKTISLNNGDGPRFLWDQPSPFGWDSGLWD